MPGCEDKHFLDPPRSVLTEAAGSCLPDALDGRQIGSGCGDFAIDWQEAAPSWSALFAGVILPVIGAFLVFVLVCWLIWL